MLHVFDRARAINVYYDSTGGRITESAEVVVDHVCARYRAWGEAPVNTKIISVKGPKQTDANSGGVFFVVWVREVFKLVADDTLSRNELVAAILAITFTQDSLVGERAWLAANL